MPPINEYDDMITNISQQSQPAQAAPTPQPSSANQVQIQVPDDYDSMLNQEKDSQKTQLQSSMMVAAQTEPDRRAKVLELSQKMNLPPNVVERNFDDVQKKAVQASVDYDGIINNTPGLAKWLENPDNASIGRNDIDPLERIDESIRVVTPNRSQSGLLDFPADLTRAGKTGFNNLRASAWHLGAAYGLIDVREAANQIAESNKRAQELQAKMPDYSQEFNKAMAEHGGDTNKAFAQFTSSFDEYRDGKILDALKDFGGGGAATVGETIDMIKAAAVRPRGLIYSTVENLAQSLPSLLTGAAGAAIAGPVGFVGGSFAGQVPVEVGSWISESMAKRGIDTTDPDQIVAAYQNPQFMAEIRSQAERKGLTTAAVDSVFNAFAGKVVHVGPGSSVLKKTATGLADVGIQAVGESASEFSGQVAAQKGDLSKVDFGESIQEGITSLGHAMGETVVGSAASVRNKFSKQPVHAAQEIAIVTDNALQAQSDAQSLAHIGEAVKEVSFAQSMPGKLKELVDIASKGDESASVYFDVPAWDEHWTKQGKSPAQMAEQIMGDGGHRYFEAKESGALMEVPMSDYISHVAPTPDFEAMLPFTRTRADGMTLAEAKEHLAALPATMEELAKEATGQPPDVMTASDNQVQAKTIGDDISEKLKTAGFDDKSSKTYSKLYEKAFGTLAERAGVDAKQLFDEYNLNINKRETEAALGSDEKRLNQPGRTLLFPVKAKDGKFSVKPADDMSASASRSGDAFEIKDLNYNPKYLGVVQDMLRSLEKVASFNGASQMVADAKGMPEALKTAYRAQGFNEVDGKMVKALDKTFNQNAPAFYSKLQQTIEAKMGNSATAEQVRGIIKEMKPEEIKWSGIEDFLKGKEKVSKAELVEFLKANQLEIKDVTKGGATDEEVKGEYEIRENEDGSFRVDDWAGNTIRDELTQDDAENFIDSRGQAEGATKFSQYTLPGGTNYKEVLFTLPSNSPSEVPSDHEMISHKDWMERTGKDPKKKTPEGYDWLVLDADKHIAGHGSTQEAAIENLHKISKPGGDSNFRSPHFEEPNVLAHVRLNDRVDSEGKKVLFVEEIQSDWHQAGRKKGYQGEKTEAPTTIPDDHYITKANDEKTFQVRDAQGRIGGNGPTEASAIRDFWDAKQKHEGAGTVPDAPFKKTWHEFAMKKIIRMAAENGYDKVAWTSGEQQAARYDLSKQINSVDYHITTSRKSDGGAARYNVQVRDKSNDLIHSGAHTASELEGIIGKELTQKIVENSTKKKQRLEGLDLKVGGEGMKGFYDKILVDFVNKFGKKFDAKVGESNIPEASKASRYDVVNKKTGENISSFETEAAAKKFVKDAKPNSVEIQAVTADSKVHSLELTPKLRDAALNEGFSLFQGGPGDTRGQIRFGENAINIDILKNADMSTFLHETGHFYLEVLGDLAEKEGTPQQIKDDYASILKWMNVADRASIGVDQHEQFARGFEAYLMEGKAPSRDLQQAFTRFKVWLTEIYKQLKNLAVDLTPEVRDVFNRMLATDEEITDATAEQSLNPIFKDPAAFGMTGKKAEDYITAREEARSFAENKLFNQLMEKHRQEKAQWYKDQKANVKAEVTKQVDGSVLYRAIAIMRSGTLADGSPAPEGTTNIKLDRQSIVTAYGEDFVKSLPSGVVASKNSEGGIHYDAAAPLFGFESGDSMMKQLSNAPKKEDTINQITQARMNELHPDLLTEDPEKLNDEAMKAIHNDARAKMLRMELEHMVTMNPSSVKEVVKRTARRVPTEMQIRDQAEKAIGRRNTGDLNPYLFQRAERKYAKEAGELLTKGDFDGAFQSKQKELYNHELYRAATEAGERVEKDLAKFKKISKSDEKVSKTRDIDLVNAARAVLTRFGIGKAEKSVEDYLGQMRQYDPDTYNTMMALVNSATQNVGPYQSVPYDDFVAMSDSVNAIWDLAKSKQEILAEGERHNIEDVKQQLAGKINEIVPEGKQMGYDKAVSDMDKVKVQLLGARASLTRVEHWTEAVDVKAGGPFKKFIWTPISEATTQYRLAKEKVLKEYKTILEDIKGTTAPKPIEANEIGYTFKDRTELLMAVLHTGNESNFSKLLRGRKWGDTDMNGNLDTSKWDAFIKRAWDEKILTKADYDFAQKIWNLLESIKPEAQKAHKDMYGYYFNEITAKKIQTPFGEYAGGYIPAKVDIYTNEDASIRHEREEFERNNNSFQFPTTGRGFTKSRVDQYAAPLSLEMSMLGGHIDGVMRFAHIEPAVKKTARIVQDKEFRAQLAKLDPAVGKELLTPWLQRAAQQKVVFPSDSGIGKLTDGVAKYLRGSVAMQLMVGNVSNTLQQVTGLVVAMSKVAPRNIRNALVTYVGDIKGTTEAALEKSEWMRSAQGSSIYETSQAIDQIIVDPTTFDTVKAFAKKHTYFMQTAAQNMVNTIVWTAAYDQAIEKGALETEAVRTADGAVRTTQGTNNPEDISRFETGTPTQRLFTQFAGYFNMLANLNGSELQKISREVGLKKGAGRAFYVYLTAFMLPAVLSEGIMRAMSGKGADANDDDKYLDDALSVFFGSQFKTATAAIPYAGQALNATYNNFNGNLNDDRMSLSPVISTIESMAGVPAEIYKTMHGDVANKKRVVKDALMLTGVLSNLPIGPIGKPVGYAMDLKSGRARPSGPIDAARGYITGAPGKAK